MSEEIRIYVADLAAYNAGYLHGQWIDATQGEDAMWEEINAMLAHTPLKHEVAEGIAIHDYEGFGKLDLYEYTSIQKVTEYATFIQEHGKLGSALLAEFDLDEAREMLTDRYLGEYGRVLEYAEQLLNECYDIPPYLENYIDYERFARDLELGGDIESYETNFGEVHIFSRA